MLIASIVTALTVASLSPTGVQDGESRQGSRLYRALQEREAIIARTAGLRGGISPQQWVQQTTAIPGQSLSIAARTLPGLPFNAFCGTAGGGVFQTGPTAWFPVDPYLGTLSVGDLTFDPATDNTMYACTGQGYSDTAFGSTNYAPMPGAGIYVSRDAGATWDVIPSTINWEIVHQLRVSPANSNTMLAATPYGLLRTTDGGVTWALKLPGYFCSAVFNLNNGTRAAAAMKGGQIYRSLDGGETWTASTQVTGSRVEVQFGRAPSSVLYALATNNGFNYLWQSTDHGVSFTQCAAPPVPTNGDRSNALYTDPESSFNILYAGQHLYRSTDGGATGARVITGLPESINDIASFSTAANPKGVFIATDFGNFRVLNFTTATTADPWNGGMVTANFLSFTGRNVSLQSMAGTTPNGTYVSTTGGSSWSRMIAEPGGSVENHPLTSSIGYGSSQRGKVYRSTNNRGTNEYIYNIGPNPIFDADSDATNKVNTILLDPNNPSRLYSCHRRLWRTQDALAAQPSWEVAKDELPGTAGPSEDPRNISAIAVAHGNSDLIVVGHNNGQIWRTTNGLSASPTWTQVDLPTMPKRWVNKLVFDKLDTSRIFACFSGWESGNLWRSVDGGATWTDISTGVLPSAPVNAVLFSPADSWYVFVGTDVGLFASDDNGDTWSTRSEGPGIVPVKALHYFAPYVWAATYGGALYRVDISNTTLFESPTAFTKLRGSSFTGRLQDTFRLDDKTLKSQADHAVPRNAPNVEIEFVGRLKVQPGTLYAVAALETNTANIRVSILMYNYVTQTWVESAKVPPERLHDYFYISLEQTTSPMSFIGPNGETRSRVRAYFDATAPRTAEFRVEMAHWAQVP